MKIFQGPVRQQDHPPPQQALPRPLLPPAAVSWKIFQKIEKYFSHFFQSHQRQQDRVHKARHILRACSLEPPVSLSLFREYFLFSHSVRNMKTSKVFLEKLKR